MIVATEFYLDTMKNVLQKQHPNAQVRREGNVFYIKLQGERKVKEETKKGIRITVEEYTRNGSKYVRVKDISALEYHQLPKEYFIPGEPAVFVCGGSFGLYQYVDEMTSNLLLLVDYEYSKTYFTRCLKLIYDAGTRLGKINKARKEAPKVYEYVI